MDVVELMRSLVAIPSVFPSEEALSNYIAQRVLALGCSVQRVDSGEGRRNLVVTTHPATKYLGFYGHLDTVPPASDYTRNPFEVIEADGRAFGLGVCDMKGGLACILYALADARKRGLPLKACFAVDEENISVGAHAVIDSGLLNDVEFLIAAESGQVIDTDKAYSLGYGRKGRIVIEVTIRGTKAHAAEADKGENAILLAARFCALVAALKLPTHPRLGANQLVIQQINASSDSFSVPDSCTMRLSLLSCPGTTSHEVIQKLKEVAGAAGISADIKVVPRHTPYCEAYEIATNNPFLRTLSSSVFSRDHVTPVYNPSVADECIFAHRLAIPVLSLGPIGAGDHTAQEWVDLASLRRTADVFCEIAELYVLNGADGWAQQSAAS